MQIRFFLQLLIVLSIIVGCSNEANYLSEVNKQNEELKESIYKNPPQVTISNGVEEVNGLLGPYGWTSCCNNGKSISVQASSDAPPNLVQNRKPLKVTSGTTISIEFETPPIKYEVKTWGENNDVTGSFTEIDTITHKGRTVFEILATWEQGIASYSFLVDIEHESGAEAVINTILISLESKEGIELFAKAVATSKKEPGIVNMANPQYQFSLGEESYFLWITEKAGTIMNTKDTHTIYSLSRSSVEEIYEFVNKVN
ncbi:hypothetical protein DS745_03135 [Anaerobacillus alkaliphilus]|uniref:YhfM-like domain-containing protein n=1 Tax=Anaerobacillus alkaliphilus TaxID=1548597 RepID=A0A4Q0VXC0_9BACI|nr:hypothetical protein [Anaerobacillus alkaliphilus]RXJ04393.1 hypothetical protein DS745_03135 [Anaerobacillus alkaliphilus]